MPAAIAPIAGSIVGGLMSDDGGGGGQTQTKDPWGPAQKPLQNTLTNGQALETYYQQNPFNPIQQTGYQNLVSDLDNFRNTMAPQAQAFNNRLMGTNYQRAPAGSELGGSMQQINASQFLPPEMRQSMGQPMQSSYTPGVMQGNQPANQTKPMVQGLLSPQGMSVVAPNSQSYGLLNWKELNPYTATNGIPRTPVDTKPNNGLSDDETFAQMYDRLIRQREQESNRYYGGGGS